MKKADVSDRMMPPGSARNLLSQCKEISHLSFLVKDLENSTSSSTNTSDMSDSAFFQSVIRLIRGESVGLISLTKSLIFANFTKIVVVCSSI